MYSFLYIRFYLNSYLHPLLQLYASFDYHLCVYYYYLIMYRSPRYFNPVHYALIDILLDLVSYHISIVLQQSSLLGIFIRSLLRYPPSTLICCFSFALSYFYLSAFCSILLLWKLSYVKTLHTSCIIIYYIYG